jgi:hypothetical protein
MTSPGAAEAAGVVVALETHGAIMASGKIALPLLERIGRESIKVNYDTANVAYYSGSSAVDDLPKIVDYLAHVHLKEDGGWEGDLALPRVRRRNRRLQSRTGDPTGRSVQRPLFSRNRVSGRTVATAERSHGRIAALVRAFARSWILSEVSIVVPPADHRSTQLR